MAGDSGSDTGLFDTVIKLVNVGFAGVGVVVLLLLFIILMKGASADEATQRLRNRFLTWGMSFAFFCGILALVGPWLNPALPPAKPADMLLSFSPRFESEGLPAPNITLPNGKIVSPGTSFPAQSGQVLVSVDDALKQVASLKKVALTLANTAKEAQKQADEAVESLTESGGAAPASAPVAAAAAEAKEASQQNQQATASVTSAIRTGDFEQLDIRNRTLDAATKASIGARARVISKF